MQATETKLNQIASVTALVKLCNGFFLHTAKIQEIRLSFPIA